MCPHPSRDVMGNGVHWFLVSVPASKAIAWKRTPGSAESVDLRWRADCSGDAGTSDPQLAESSESGSSKVNRGMQPSSPSRSVDRHTRPPFLCHPNCRSPEDSCQTESPESTEHTVPSHLHGVDIPHGTRTLDPSQIVVSHEKTVYTQPDATTTRGN